MASFINKIKRVRESLPGRIIEVLVYAAMLLAVLAFFTGNGEFIYEGF